MKKRLKINGAIIFLALLLLALFPKIFFSKDNPGFSDTMIEVAGLAAILLGQLLRVSARGFKAEHSKEGGLLIKSGPYALVRNPMYLGILLIGLGIVLMLFQWWVVVIFLAIFFIRYILLIYAEEKKLNVLFAKEYPSYKTQVPRILPSLSAISKADIKDCLPLKLSWLKKEIGPILTVLFIVLFLESWEDIINKSFKVYSAEALVMLVMFFFFLWLIFYLSRRASRQNTYAADKS